VGERADDLDVLIVAVGTQSLVTFGAVALPPGLGIEGDLGGVRVLGLPAGGAQGSEPSLGR